MLLCWASVELCRTNRWCRANRCLLKLGTISRWCLLSSTTEVMLFGVYVNKILVINKLQLNLRNEKKSFFHALSLAGFLGELLTGNLSMLRLVMGILWHPALIDLTRHYACPCGQWVGWCECVCVYVRERERERMIILSSSEFSW